MRSFWPHLPVDLSRLPSLLSKGRELMFDFQGHAGRRDFWIGTALIAVFLLILERVLFRHWPMHAPLAMLLCGAVMIYPFGALATKRGRDRGHGENWGMGLVIAAMLTGIATKVLSGGPWALHASLASIGVWLFTLVDLGLMPSASERPDAVASTRATRTVGVKPRH